MTQAQILNAADIKAFMFGGDATFTAVSKKTKAVLKINVKLADKGPKSAPSCRPWFIKARPFEKIPNANELVYVGVIWLNQGDLTLKYVHGRNSILSSRSVTARAVRHVIDSILKEDADPGFQVWHTGVCSRCGRTLTDPESIKMGMGPICRKIVRKETDAPSEGMCF